MNKIYTLTCPLTGAVRYIGKTADIEQRLITHVSEAPHQRHHRGYWITGLRKRGLKPAIRVLFSVPDGDEWQAWERFFIASATAFGLNLTNCTAGGDGVDFTDEASRRRMQEYISSPENRERAAEHSREIWSRPGMKELKSKAVKAGWSDPVKAASRRAKMSEGKRAEWAARKQLLESDPAARLRFDAYRDAQRAGSLARPSKAKSPEAKARQLAGIARSNEARRLEKLRRIMEWDKV